MVKNKEINVKVKFKLILWEKLGEKKIIWILTNNKKVKISLNTNKNNLFIDKWTNCIIIKNNKFNTNSVKTNNNINKFLNSVNKFFYKKIKFKGKGFRIKFFKKIKLIKFYFGKSHKTFYLIKNIKIKKINKYKFILSSLNNFKINALSKKLINIKYINIYTLRGIRTSRQIIFKRKGKKGTYI